MLVQEIVDTVRNSTLLNLNFKKDESIVFSYIQLGLSDLYNRLNLGIKSEVMRVTPAVYLYEMKNKDVNLLLDIYDSEGKPLVQSDVAEHDKYDYKMINYKSFLLKNPPEGQVTCIYKAAPVKVTEMNQDIDLPYAMLEALTLYVGYIANVTVSKASANRSNLPEMSSLYQQYLQAINNLITQGYQISIATETRAIQEKGFV